MLRLVAGALPRGSEVQQAARLLRGYSAAAAQAESQPDALRQLLLRESPPGEREWPPAMALALALAGAFSRELDLDAPLRRGVNDSLVVQETKLSAKGKPGGGGGGATPRICSAGAVRPRASRPTPAPAPPLAAQVWARPATSCAAPSACWPGCTPR